MAQRVEVLKARVSMEIEISNGRSYTMTKEDIEMRIGNRGDDCVRVGTGV